MRGTVLEEIGDHSKLDLFTTKSGVGSFLSYGNAVLGNEEALSSARAVTNVTVNEVSYEEVMKIMENEPKFEEKIYR